MTRSALRTLGPLLSVLLCAVPAPGMYHPETGRFLQRDPAGYDDGLNLYLYVGCRTVTDVDPTGLEGEPTKKPAQIEYKIWTRTAGNEVKDAGGSFKLPSGDDGTVRIFLDVRIERGSHAKRTWQMHGKLIQLEFTSKANCDKCHWLQFIYRYELDKEGKQIKGVYIATGAFHPLGEAGRHVDSSHPTDPFYDRRGLSLRTKNQISIFDRPSLTATPSKHSETGTVVDSFLVCDKKPYWHVHYELVYKPDKRGIWRSEWKNVTGKAPNGLPDWARKAKLPGGYRRRDRKTDELSRPYLYNNPIDPKWWNPVKPKPGAGARAAAEAEQAAKDAAKATTTQGAEE